MIENMQLTARQDEVVQAVTKLTAELGYAPTTKEIATAVGICKTRAWKIIDRLVVLRVLARESGTSRTTRIVR